MKKDAIIITILSIALVAVIAVTLIVSGIFNREVDFEYGDGNRYVHVTYNTREYTTTQMPANGAFAVIEIDVQRMGGYRFYDCVMTFEYTPSGAWGLCQNWTTQDYITEIELGYDGRGLATLVLFAPTDSWTETPEPPTLTDADFTITTSGKVRK